MAFTVDDVQDLLQLLREHPEWREAVRREVLGEELLALPELVRQNSTDIAELREAVAELRQAIADLTVVVGRHGDDLGYLKGRSLESEVRQAPWRFLPTRRMRRPTTIPFDELEQVLTALDGGVLTEEQVDDVRLLDVIVRGRVGSDRQAQDQYLAVEVSSTIDQSGVERAARRAAILRLAGVPALPAVTGNALSEYGRSAAERDGVEVFIQPIGAG
jgi:hypothetical protein